MKIIIMKFKTNTINIEKDVNIHIKYFLTAHESIIAKNCFRISETTLYGSLLKILKKYLEKRKRHLQLSTPLFSFSLGRT